MFVKVLFLLLSFAGSMVTSAAMAAIEVDGQPAYQSGSDAGLYIWRSTGGSWSIRLSAGGGNQKFAGTIETTQQFKSFSGVSIETHDSVVETGAGKIDIQLQAWGGGEDGIDLAVSQGSGLCLKSTGNGNAVIYVGANATRVTAPVDLTGSGACGGTTQTNDVSSSRKYNPGHYIAMIKWTVDDHPAMIDSIKPGVVGFVKRYYWRDLEPSFGQYDFSQVRRDLDLLAGQGMQLIIVIEDKSFKNQKPTPSYLSNEYVLPNRIGGYTAVRWAPYVVERMNALTAAMGKQFDSHPNFEGIAIQETALGLDSDARKAAGYTPEKYRDALIDVLTDAAQNFPTSRVFWYMNFLVGKQSYIADVALAVAPHGVVVGGPDALPDDGSLVRQTYPFYDQFNGKMPLFCSMQFNSYRHLHEDASYPTKYWTMGEMFRFMRDDLHVNYMFWTRKTRSWPAGSYDWTDALPVIGSNPAFNY